MRENAKWFAVNKVETSKINVLRDNRYCDIVYEDYSFAFSSIHDYKVILMYAYEYNFTWNDLLYQSDYNYVSNDVYTIACRFVNDGFGNYLVKFFV